MGRARENFNSVYFKDETGAQMSFANGSYANKLRFIFWNLMDSHVLKLEGPACDFTIEAWAKRAYLVQEDRRTHEVKRYEIMNCTYRELSGKISKKHAPEETPSCYNSVCCVLRRLFTGRSFTTSSSQRCPIISGERGSCLRRLYSAVP